MNSSALKRAGSSPLTRGKHRAEATKRRERGLIPAHAGKTRDGVLKSMSIGAHPRSRGENLLFDNVGKDIPGSSPLTRGKPHRTVERRSRGRLIPAHAGKT